MVRYQGIGMLAALFVLPLALDGHALDSTRSLTLDRDGTTVQRHHRHQM